LPGADHIVQILTKLGESIGAVQNQATTLEIDHTITEGKEFVETQIVGSHGHCNMKRCFSLCNAVWTPRCAANLATWRSLCVVGKRGVMAWSLL
jgi:hypothetical protein